MTPSDVPVRVAALKARLSEYLRAVRGGQAVIVYDRDTPIARLVPYVANGDPVSIRPPLRALHAIPLPPPLGGRVNSRKALLGERQSER